jgi:hypothetical protein
MDSACALHFAEFSKRILLGDYRRTRSSKGASSDNDQQLNGGIHDAPPSGAFFERTLYFVAGFYPNGKMTRQVRWRMFADHAI